MKNNNQGLLVVVVVLLVGILLTMGVSEYRERDSAGNKVNGAIEEIGDETDDRATVH